jgi:hypothetical protein
VNKAVGMRCCIRKRSPRDRVTPVVRLRDATLLVNEDRLPKLSGLVGA